jgi:WD40 repeat protein
MNGDFSFDSKYIVTGSRDKTIKIHELEHRKTIAEMKFKKPVYSVSFAPKDYTIAVGCENGSVYIIKLVDEKLVELAKIEDYVGHSGIVNRLCWT